MHVVNTPCINFYNPHDITMIMTEAHTSARSRSRSWLARSQDLIPSGVALEPTCTGKSASKASWARGWLC